MKGITQIIKRLLAFLLDINIVVFLFNLSILFLTFIFSKHYGDFIGLLHHIENDPQYFLSIIFVLTIIFILLYLVFVTLINKDTIGLKLFGFKLIPENNINVINLFLKFITGFIIDLLLILVNIFYMFKGKNSISSYISDLSIEEAEDVNPVALISGILLLFILSLFNFYFYYGNIPFKLGKQLTNYEKLLSYASYNKDSNLLERFLREYRGSKIKDQNKVNFYACILSVLRKDLDLKICKQVEKNINDFPENYKNMFYGYVGEYYFNKNDYKNALNYLEYFYNKLIFNSYYWEYLLSLKSTNSKLLLEKLNKQFDSLLSSNNYMLVYNVALLYIDNQDFKHAIELLQKLKNNKPKTIDYADVLWYLGKAQFLSKDYKNAISNMKQASAINPSKYNVLFKSYESYYKTQVKIR